jgi:hypothetical protein
MGIEVAVEDERGTRIASLLDPTNILHRALPAHDDPGFQCLNRVDWYGDTTFNRHQIPEVRRELKRLQQERKSVDEVEMISQVDLLAAKAEIGPHLYLKFHGD